MSNELMDRTASNTDTIDRTNMDVTESTGVPKESNERNNGGSKDDNISEENSPKHEGVINEADVEETGTTGKTTVSNLSTTSEVTLAASANSPVNNLELNEAHNGKQLDLSSISRSTDI